MIEDVTLKDDASALHNPRELSLKYARYLKDCPKPWFYEEKQND